MFILIVPYSTHARVNVYSHTVASYIWFPRAVLQNTHTCATRQSVRKALYHTNTVYGYYIIKNTDETTSEFVDLKLKPDAFEYVRIYILYFLVSLYVVYFDKKKKKLKNQARCYIMYTDDNSTFPCLHDQSFHRRGRLKVKNTHRS